MKLSNLIFVCFAITSLSAFAVNQKDVKCVAELSPMDCRVGTNGNIVETFAHALCSAWITYELKNGEMIQEDIFGEATIQSSQLYGIVGLIPAILTLGESNDLVAHLDGVPVKIKAIKDIKQQIIKLKKCDYYQGND